MILIVGASGFLGREAAKMLLSQGQQVRLSVRTPAKVDDLKQLGAEVMQGDLIDPASLTRACQGVDRVFAAAHSMIGKGRYKSEAVDDTGHRALIDAAKAAGAAHFVYVSTLGAAPDHPVDFWRTKFHIEEYLKASGLSYTILRPSAFMEWHVHILNGKSILESGKTSLLGKGTKSRNFVAVRDVAQFAVLALTESKLQNRTLDVGGPGNFTNNQVAEMYGKLAGVTPKVSHMPPAMAKIMTIVLKPFEPGVSRIMYLNSLPDDAFSEKFDPAALLAEFPMRLTGLEEFIGERVAETKQRSAVNAQQAGSV
jgi:NADH dehydrogenase